MYQTAAVAAPRQITLSSRLLGTFSMLVSPLILAEGIRYHFAIGHLDRIGGAGEALYMMGVLASLVGLRRLRATCDGRFASGLFVVQCVLASVAGAFSASYIVAPMQVEGGALWRAIDFAWPATHMSTLVLAITMLATRRRLRGWRAYPALASGLALPLAMACIATGVGRTVATLLFGILTTLGFGALGYVVRTSDRARLGDA